MSIEIIEKPTHKCSVCGCVFSFDREDFQDMKIKQGLKEVSLGRFRESWLRQTFVCCPICGQSHVIKEKTESKDL